MLVKTWFNVIFDELFFYEFQKCQMRASYMINKNYTRRQFCGNKNKIISVKASMYSPYEETLIYTIRKKIIFYAVNIMLEKGEIDANYFKKIAGLITEKEIQLNKKKTKRDANYYDRIKRTSLSKIDELFDLINSQDFKNPIKFCFTQKIKLGEIIPMIKKGVMPGTAKSIPDYDYKDGYPLFKHDILSLDYNSNIGSLDIVIVHMFDITEEMAHRNFFLKILFRYFYSIKDELNCEFGLEINTIDKITVYNPLTFKTCVVYFDDLKSSLSEMDLFRIMNAYIDNNLARTLNNKNCEFCENNKLCYSKTRSRNKIAIGQTFEAKRARGKAQEMI